MTIIINIRTVYKDYFIKEDKLEYKQQLEKNGLYQYVDITHECLNNRDTSYKEIIKASSVEKNGKIYLVNNTNKIELFNKEKENGEWFVNLMGGKN